jgi:hypothetical protein
MNSARRVFGTLRQLAPYALIELLLPGGTLLALGLWLYQRRKTSTAKVRQRERSRATTLAMAPR